MPLSNRMRKTVKTQKNIRVSSGAEGTAPLKKNNRKTTEQFIREARGVHGDRYDYTKVAYVNINTKVTIGCSKHGYFDVSPKSHLNGVNCKSCAYEQNAINRTWDTETFILKAKEVHGDKYRYEKSVVSKATVKCTVTCPKHGDFTLQPTTHVLGTGCKKCAGERLKREFTLGTDEFIRRAIKVHGLKYDYSKVDYKKYSEDVVIICRDHGEFNQSPGSHLVGSNCPKCVSLFYEGNYWDAHVETSLYVIQIEFSGYKMIKVGISKDVSGRLSLLTKELSGQSDLEITVLHTITGESEPICRFENELHNNPDLNHMYVGIKFGGYTECYAYKDKRRILALVRDFEKHLRSNYDCNATSKESVGNRRSCTNL